MSLAKAHEAADGFGSRLEAATHKAADELGNMSAERSGAVKEIVVLDDTGPGGTAELFAALSYKFARLRVVKAAMMEFPSFAREDSIVLLFADEADEQLAAEAAAKAVAQHARLIVVTGDRDDPAWLPAEPDRATACHVDCVPAWGAPGLAELVPCGLVLLGTLGGLAVSATAWLGTAADELRRETPALGAADGVAEVLALDLGDEIPVVVGPGPVGEAVANAWKACLLKASGFPAFASSLSDARLLAPTLVHRKKEEHGPKVRMILLRHLDEDVRESAALKEFIAGLHRLGLPHVALEPRTKDPLARFFESLVLAQLVSLRRAELSGREDQARPYRL